MRFFCVQQSWGLWPVQAETVPMPGLAPPVALSPHLGPCGAFWGHCWAVPRPQAAQYPQAGHEMGSWAVLGPTLVALCMCCGTCTGPPQLSHPHGIACPCALSNILATLCAASSWSFMPLYYATRGRIRKYAGARTRGSSNSRSV